MARELHHRKKDNKYALWSTIVDDYVTEWEDKEEIRKEEKENCKDSIEEKYLLREIYVLQSLLEKE